ncbi:MAG TPA: mycothiol system anti-sigma-R factor [Ornithinimicrobium sp.]|uniref:mycothiol system anti-sigma-R factor n=1 Tax=Ornithinimicrobium sp. TaxID=1977084 RepID=UPI002B47EC8B|nr:mycothiol system anti-sigma-R factor [Ornithinimicrobium sp.]HKJ13168.1 mycothiol system anti-sigma-R factor [Ornithinimicrobium sp.]
MTSPEYHHVPASAGAADCAAVVLRLFEYVDNEAGPEDRELIKAHLDQCGSCLREYERDLLLKSLVRRACQREEAPSALRMQVVARITTENRDADS